jgi:hypothetical protein
MRRALGQLDFLAQHPLLHRSLSLGFICSLILSLLGPSTPSALAQADQAILPIDVAVSIVAPSQGQAEIGDPVIAEANLTNITQRVLDSVPFLLTFDPDYLKFEYATIDEQTISDGLLTTRSISWSNLLEFTSFKLFQPDQHLTIRAHFSALKGTTIGSQIDPPISYGPPSRPLPGTTAVLTNPNDYYDKETRFLIDYAIDQTNGGVFLALKGDGSIWQTIPDVVYGFPPNFFEGSSKHPGGQAICIEYFVREYQRLKQNNHSIQTSTQGEQSAKDMLAWAKKCADFVNAYLIVGRGVNEPQPVPTCLPAVGNTCLYYWGFVAADGQSNHRFATGEAVQNFTPPPNHHLLDSFVAWMQAELALQLREIGDPSYTSYKQAAIDYLEWAQKVGPPRQVVGATAANPSFAGRDRFWAGLLMSLYELSLLEGTPNDAYRQEAIDCINRRGAYAGSNSHMIARCNGTSHVTAFARSAVHALEMQRRGIDNFTLPNANPIWHNFGTTRYIDNPAMPNNPTTPFAHGGGREFVAGLQRSHWFYYSFPNNSEAQNLVGGVTVPGNWTVESWSRYALLNYWKYSVEHMWDDTPGQEAWWDAELKPGGNGYKPCFSLGTPLPIGDWQAPVIGNKSHILNPDGSATVVVSGVRDEDWPYLSWNLRGIGVEAVRVFYSTDNSATWTKLDATQSLTDTTLYLATIPPQVNRTVYYYAEAEDAFGNISTYPASAPHTYQLYSLRNYTYIMAWSAGRAHSTPIIIRPEPSAVRFASLEALRRPDGLEVRWKTSLEQDVYGFYLYQSASDDRSQAQKLHSQIIVGRGSGSTYSYFIKEDQLLPNASYWLQELDLFGKSSWHRIEPSRETNNLFTVFLPKIAHSMP